MEEALKTLEAFAETQYNEINRLKNSREICDKAYWELQATTLLCIDMKRKVELARAWQVAAKK